MNRDMKRYIDEMNGKLILASRADRNNSPLLVGVYRSACQYLEALERQGLPQADAARCKIILNGIYDRHADRFKGTGIRKYEL